MSTVRAFAPGRVNLIGEHTDYNDGLCLPFAMDRGVTVGATPHTGVAVVEARALDLGEHDRIELGRAAAAPSASPPGWRRFVRGAVCELGRAGVEVRPCRLEISGDLPRSSGLASSAALAVSVCLALCGAAGAEPPEPVELARLCSRIENEWCGARTGLLDQLASLLGRQGHAVRLDLRSLSAEPVEVRLGGHTLVTLDSGASRSVAASGYNERRDECRRAAAALGVESLRDAPGAAGDLARLPELLGRRVRHVVTENARVDAAVGALRAGDPKLLGALLDASHRSLRDDFEVSAPGVERAIGACRDAGALGARVMGAGFGGSVLALLPPDAPPPAGASRVAPAAGARLL